MIVAERRASPLLDRNPVFAAFALAACAFLLWDLAPDVSYALSSREAIDLGGPGAYHLDRARPNRLHRVAGAAAGAVSGTSQGGEERTVVGLSGANLLVDHARGAPAGAYEGRLLPARRAADYAPVAAALRARGLEPAPDLLVLRDGERPGDRAGRVLLAVLVVAVAAINLRALARRLAS